MSRPWFVYEVEEAEQAQRLWYLPGTHEAYHYEGEVVEPVSEFGEERADCSTQWNSVVRENGCAIGWEWPHESPSPEPEDLSFIGADDMEDHFTPSEAEALEDKEIPVDKRSYQWRAQVDWLKNDPGTIFPSWCVNGPSEPRQGASASPPPPTRRGRSARSQKVVPLAPAQLRGSARIKARLASGESSSLDLGEQATGGSETSAEPVPSARPSKPMRRNQGRAAARPVPSRPPPPGVATSKGRPKKSGSSDRPSGISKASPRASNSRSRQRANMRAAVREIVAEGSTLVCANGVVPTVSRGRGR